MFLENCRTESIVFGIIMEKNKIKNPMVNINTRAVDSILLWFLCIGIFCSNLSSTHFCGLFNINANPIPRRKGNSIVIIN